MIISPAVAQVDQDKTNPPLVAEVLGTKIHTNDSDEMKYMILRSLLDRYAADKGIVVKQEEIEAYVESLRRASEQNRSRWVQRREKLIQEQKSTPLTDAERKSISSQIETLDALLASPDETSNTAAQAAAEEKRAREQVAAAFIWQWKVNRSLYEQYGGRVIFQQGGPEPLDAYHRFLEGQEKSGAFKIFHQPFEAEFWKYYLDDSIHSFYPAGSPQEAQVFKTPWWLEGLPASDP